MRDIIKSILFFIWPIINSYLPDYSFKLRVDYYVRMGILKKNNMPVWRVEKATEMGVAVGRNCRFYSLNIFSEPYLVEVGDNVIISGEVILLTHDGAIYLFQKDHPNVYGNFGRIKIGNNCFIGMGAIIMPNVEIGNNCIIGAGSVVMDSIPDDSVVIGNPARVAYKTSMYKKMKIHSKMTLSHETYPFPHEEDMPIEMKRELLIKSIGMLPIKKARSRNSAP